MVTTQERRYTELDSMRGIAAVIVLFHHFFMMFCREALKATSIPALIYPLIAGRESVMLFFMLSGFVLALPQLRGKSQSYPVYLLRRTLRIYGPYLGALAFAVAGCALWHNRLPAVGDGQPPWGAPVSFGSVLQAVLFIGNGDDGRYNPSFWSLVQEMRISIIFPILIFVSQRTGLVFSLVVVAICTAVGVQSPVSPMVKFFGSVIMVEYIGIFMLGILLATHIKTISNWYEEIPSWGRYCFGILSCALYYLSHDMSGMWWHLGDMPVALGAAGFIVVGLNSARAKIILNHRIFRFVGKISYSLYLVHGTVLFILAALLQGRVSSLTFLLIFVPVSILLSWGFYIAVEAPFMRLSQRVGRGRAKPPVDNPSAQVQSIAIGT
jgi:peptidoglycan/LPS O-acetylase OafA/YrhL